MSLACKLHEAAKAGRLRALEKLLDEGYHVDLVEGGFTALYIAVEAGNVNTVEFLLARKANPNVRCVGGATALHVACRHGSQAMLSLLISCGGDLRLRDDEGRTPAEWAHNCLDPVARARILQLVMRKRSEANRITDGFAADDQQHTAGGISQIKRRLSSGNQRKKWCLERLISNGGFGSLYQRGAQVGVATHIDLMSSGLLFLADDARSTWMGPMSVLQTMYRGTLRVSVKRATANRQLAKGGFRSDVILQEIENLRRLSAHPAYLWPLAISPVQNMEDAYIVYEAVHFGTLFDVLHRSSGAELLDDQTRTQLPPNMFSINNVLVLLRQICEALMFLHEGGFLHGCVSPHAIMVVSAAQAKLSGFEFMVDESACSTSTLGGSSSFLQQGVQNEGSKYSIGDRSMQDYFFHWLAPEVLAQRVVRRQSDVYSLACVAWETFVGIIPWEEFDLDEAFQALVVQKKRLAVPDDIPEPLYGVLQTALRSNLDKRDATLDEMYHSLSAVVAEFGDGGMPLTYNRRVTLQASRRSGNSFASFSQYHPNNHHTAGDNNADADMRRKTLKEQLSMRSSFRTPPPYVEEGSTQEIKNDEDDEEEEDGGALTEDSSVADLTDLSSQPTLNLPQTPKRRGRGGRAGARDRRNLYTTANAASDSFFHGGKPLVRKSNGHHLMSTPRQAPQDDHHHRNVPRPYVPDHQAYQPQQQPSSNHHHVAHRHMSAPNDDHGRGGRPDSATSQGSQASNVSVTIREATRLLKERIGKLGSTIMPVAQHQQQGKQEGASHSATTHSNKSKSGSAPGPASGRGQAVSPILQADQHFVPIEHGGKQNGRKQKSALPAVGRSQGKFNHVSQSPSKLPGPHEKSLRFEDEDIANNNEDGFTTCHADPRLNDREAPEEEDDLPTADPIYAKIDPAAKKLQEYQPQVASAPPVPPKQRIDEVDGLRRQLQKVDLGSGRGQDHEEEVNEETAFLSIVQQDDNQMPNVRGLAVEPNHTYKLEVITGLHPNASHRLRVTKTNNETGAVEVREELGTADSITFEFTSDDKENIIQKLLNPGGSSARAPVDAKGASGSTMKKFSKIG